MKLRVAQTRPRDTIQRGCRNDTAERARNTVALVVRHDEQDVGRAFWRHDAWLPPRCGILDAFLDHAAERHRRRRELFSADGGGRAWGGAGGGEPRSPVTCCAGAEEAVAMKATANIWHRRMCLADFMGVNLVCCRSYHSSE